MLQKLTRPVPKWFFCHRLRRRRSCWKTKPSIYILCRVGNSNPGRSFGFLSVIPGIRKAIGPIFNTISNCAIGFLAAVPAFLLTGRQVDPHAGVLGFAPIFQQLVTDMQSGRQFPAIAEVLQNAIKRINPHEKRNDCLAIFVIGEHLFVYCVYLQPIWTLRSNLSLLIDTDQGHCCVI